MSGKELANLENMEVDWRDQVRAGRACGIIPKTINSDEAALGVILKGRELGISPMQAFSQIHVIQGQPTLSAQAMLALAYKRLPGFEMELVKSTPELCEIRMRRAADKPWSALAYTIKQAQQAGVAGKSNWKQHPDDMLRNRVVSKLLKMIAPDVFAGIYTPDEAESIGPELPDTSQARQVEARLLGEDESESAPEPTESAAPGPAPGPVDDWSIALEQTDSLDAWHEVVGQIKDDSRLTDADLVALRAVAKRKAVSEGWK